jgi:3-oxoacyl-[acyl-carrier protein] reductase
MDLRIADASVLLVGASRGIGLATARAFAAEGARVAIVARHEDELRRAAAAIEAETAAATGARGVAATTPTTGGARVLAIAADATR